MEGAPKKKGWFGGVRAGLGRVWGLAPGVGEVWRQTFWVDLKVLLRFALLCALSVPIVTLYWTLPRILDLQLATPVAVLEGEVL